MTSIYIASPYKIGDKNKNVYIQKEIYHILMSAGHYPYAPLLNHYIDEVFPHTEDEWLKQDKYWLLKCDYLLRLPGESAGADKEVQWARDADIPVYFDIVELMRHLYEGKSNNAPGIPPRFRDL